MLKSPLLDSDCNAVKISISYDYDAEHLEVRVDCQGMRITAEEFRKLAKIISAAPSEDV